MPIKAIRTNGHKLLIVAKPTPVSVIRTAAPERRVFTGARPALTPASSVSMAEPNRVAVAIIPVARAP